MHPRICIRYAKDKTNCRVFFPSYYTYTTPRDNVLRPVLIDGHKTQYYNMYTIHVYDRS